MILVTGGLGFIGQHTARALIEMGQTCLLTRHRSAGESGHISEAGVVVETADVGDAQALAVLGKRYEITGIVHLAGGPVGSSDLVDSLRVSSEQLFNVLRVAHDCRVGRVTVASTIGVYAGATKTSPLREDAPLPVHGMAPIPAAKKSAETIGKLVAERGGFGFAAARISAAWGPLGRPASPFFTLPRMVHAAVAGEIADFSGPPPTAYEDDGIDMCHVADVGRALALLATTPSLRYDTYNVGSGRATTAGQVAAAVRTAVPDTKIVLPAGRNPDNPDPDPYLDITRLREDTGFTPSIDLAAGIVDYVDWLRTGHAR
jgi:UDP-glucose 4-epimerase